MVTKKKFRIRQTEDVGVVQDLHRQTFPYDAFDETPARGNVYWLVHDDEGKPVAFAAARQLAREKGVVFLSRAGVVREARGCGLQRRLIRLRLRWAQSHGAHLAVTYCAHDNISSARNLFACGMDLYLPQDEWGGPTSLYFRKDLV